MEAELEKGNWGTRWMPMGKKRIKWKEEGVRSLFNPLNTETEYMNTRSRGNQGERVKKAVAVLQVEFRQKICPLNAEMLCFKNKQVKSSDFRCNTFRQCNVSTSIHPTYK